MKARKRYITLSVIISCIIFLILDRSTAMEGAKEGLEVCIQTVVPSLFPFMFLTSVLTSIFSSSHIKHNSVICWLYQIPSGTEGVLLAGLLGGYPIGAKCVSDAVRKSGLSSSEAERMIVFCNATGPAFLFGVTSSIFPVKWIPWCLWGIHILSGLFIARLSSNTHYHITMQTTESSHSIPQQLKQTIRAMSEICGWIVLMRVGISVIHKRFLQHLPVVVTVLISGMIELSTGCFSLLQIDSMALRFVLCSVFLNFGGYCVALQTQSVSSGMNQYKYISGKCLQAILGFVMAYTVQLFAFPPGDRIHFPILFSVIISLIFIYCIYTRCITKNSCRIFR